MSARPPGDLRSSPSSVPTPRIPVERTTARLLVIDDDDRVLLFTDSDPGIAGSRWWITPGGGIEAGESPREAALRELHEETGRLVAPDQLIGPIAARVTTFRYSDRDVRNHETYFLVRVPAFVVDTAGHTPQERLTMTGYRWWTLGELVSTTELVVPTGLHLLCCEAAGTQDGPIDLGSWWVDVVTDDPASGSQAPESH